MFPPSCNKICAIILYIFITTPHPSISLHFILFYSYSILFYSILFYSILFYSIYSTTVHTIYFIFQFIFLFLCIYIYICVFLFSSYFYCLCCCCLCALEACETKTNSLYAQAFLAIKLFPTSDYYYVYMSYLSFWNKLYLWKYVMYVFIF